MQWRMNKFPPEFRQESYRSLRQGSLLLAKPQRKNRGKIKLKLHARPSRASERELRARAKRKVRLVPINLASSLIKRSPKKSPTKNKNGSLPATDLLISNLWISESKIGPGKINTIPETSITGYKIVGENFLT